MRKRIADQLRQTTKKASPFAKNNSTSVPNTRVTTEIVTATNDLIHQYYVLEQWISTAGNIQFKQGDAVTVAWKNNKPFVILGHAFQKAQFPPRTPDTVGILEELVYVDLGNGQWDIYLRNDQQFTALKIQSRVSGVLPVLSSRPFIRWGEKRNTFAIKTISVSPFGTGSMVGFKQAYINLPTFYIFTLNRTITKGLGATPAKATLTKVLVCPIFDSPYTYDSIDTLVTSQYTITFPAATPRNDGALKANETDFYLTDDLDIVVLSDISEFYFRATDTSTVSYDAVHPMVVSCTSGSTVYDHVYDQLGKPTASSGVFINKSITSIFATMNTSILTWSKRKINKCILILPFLFEISNEDTNFDPEQLTADGQRAIYLEGPNFARMYISPLEDAVVDPDAEKNFQFKDFYPTVKVAQLGNINEEHFLWSLSSFPTKLDLSISNISETLYIVTPTNRTLTSIATVEYLYRDTRTKPEFLQALHLYGRAFQALSISTLFCIDERDTSFDQDGLDVFNLVRLWPKIAYKAKFLKVFNENGVVVSGLDLGPNNEVLPFDTKSNKVKLKDYPTTILAPHPVQPTLYMLLGS